jgi:hypothetical protein
VVGKRRNDQERKVEGVAFTNIYQGTWYRLFRQLKSDRKIKDLVGKFLKSTSDDEQIVLLNKINEANVNNVVALTGENGTVLNAFLFAFSPDENISVVTLSDRYKIMHFFELDEVRKIQSLSWGERIIISRKSILSLNQKLNLNTDGRGICAFLYSEPTKRLWKQEIRLSRKRKERKDRCFRETSEARPCCWTTYQL